MQNIWKKTDPLKWPLPNLINKEGIQKYEYSLFSQNGEDGILRYLFSEIGFSSKLFLEFGFGVTENNSLRLMLKEGFGGIFIDGNELSVKYFNSPGGKSRALPTGSDAIGKPDLICAVCRYF